MRPAKGKKKQKMTTDMTYYSSVGMTNLQKRVKQLEKELESYQEKEIVSKNTRQQRYIATDNLPPEAVIDGAILQETRELCYQKIGREIGRQMLEMEGQLFHIRISEEWGESDSWPEKITGPFTWRVLIEIDSAPGIMPLTDIQERAEQMIAIHKIRVGYSSSSEESSEAVS